MAQSLMPPTAESLYADVRYYASLGNHRTASRADQLTAEWVCDRLSKLGIEARLDPWPLSQFELQECRVDIYGRQLDAYPLWYPKSSGADALSAEVRPLTDTIELTDRIALIAFNEQMVTPNSSYQCKINEAKERGAKAVIACTPHISGEIFVPNAIPPHNQSAWPLPVAMVPPKHWHIMQHAASTGDTVEFKLYGQHNTTAIANNVVGQILRGKRWIIVSTPQSGWFRCAGERGAGVALMLALAHRLSSKDVPQSVMFLSNSGHEIGHMGIHHLMAQDTLPSPADTDCWLHLGSSIGTRAYQTHNGIMNVTGPEPESWLYASESMIEKLQRAFTHLPHLAPETYNRKNGEIRWILENGYSAFALMGPQQYFHLRDDGPEVVDPHLLFLIYEALYRALKI